MLYISEIGGMDMKNDEKKILLKETKEQPKDKDRKYSKTYEAALKLKGSIKVNDLTLFFR